MQGHTLVERWRMFWQETNVKLTHDRLKGCWFLNIRDRSNLKKYKFYDLFNLPFKSETLCLIWKAVISSRVEFFLKSIRKLKKPKHYMLPPCRKKKDTCNLHVQCTVKPCLIRTPHYYQGRSIWQWKPVNEIKFSLPCKMNALYTSAQLKWKGHTNLFRLRIVTHFPSGIAQRAKSVRA